MLRFHTAVGRLPLVCAALLACGLLAACGSSSSSSTTNATAAAATGSSGATAGGPSRANRSAFRKCLQQHGVTLPNRRPFGGYGAPPPGGGNGAPPYGGGGFFGGGGARGLANNPKLSAAVKACGGSRFPRGGGRFRLSHASVTNFVACVRQHGFANMPSPNFSGKGPIFPSSIRTNPQFVSAAKACASLLRPPGAPPSGTSGSTAPATS